MNLDAFVSEVGGQALVLQARGGLLFLTGSGASREYQYGRANR